MKTQTEGAAMELSTPKTGLQPATQLRKSVFGVSLHFILLAGLMIATTSEALAQQPPMTEFGFSCNTGHHMNIPCNGTADCDRVRRKHNCDYHHIGCGDNTSSGAAASGTSKVSSQDQLLLDATKILSTALIEMFREDPAEAARLEAEAKERTLELQRIAAETERIRQENFSRLRGMLKLNSFDGDNGGLLLKGVDVEASGGLELKLRDEDLKPLGTRASKNSPDANASSVKTDPMVVDLRNLRQSAFLVRSFEAAPPADAPLLLNEALKVANGDKSFVGSASADSSMPAIDEKGLLAFQKANSEYRKANDFQMQCTESFNLAQRRREVADLVAKEARADLEQSKAKLLNEDTLIKKHKLMADIFAAIKVEDEARSRASAEMEAARTRNYQAKEEAIRVLRATAAGRDPATFQPPIASLPSLDEKIWMQVQEKMIASRTDLDQKNSDLRAELKGLKVPLPITYERYHEGVILGAGTDSGDANSMTSTISPFTGKTPNQMNEAADYAKKNGIQGVGGAMVVSFGTPKDGSTRQGAAEVSRVLGDHITDGQVSLNTPQGKEAIASLSGKEFDRLIAHSNGAPITEALIQADLIKVKELNILGGDRSLLNGHTFQKLLDDGKVERVVVWINVNDPIVWVTAPDQLRLADRGNDALEHIARKMTGELAGGDSRVEYRFMVGKGKGIFGPHYVETAYYPNIASELGTRWAFPRNKLEK